MAEDERADFEAEVVKTIKKRRKSDLKEVIRSVLISPTQHDGDVDIVDGSKPISAYIDANIDVMTRIVIRQALAAGNGDVKSAEFLMKYGAYTPAQETNLNVIPMIVDDIRLPDAPEAVSIAPRKAIDAREAAEGEGDGERKPVLIDILPRDDR